MASGAAGAEDLLEFVLDLGEEALALVVGEPGVAVAGVGAVEGDRAAQLGQLLDDLGARAGDPVAPGGLPVLVFQHGLAGRGVVADHVLGRLPVVHDRRGCRGAAGRN